MTGFACYVIQLYSIFFNLILIVTALDCIDFGAAVPQVILEVAAMSEGCSLIVFASFELPQSAL